MKHLRHILLLSCVLAFTIQQSWAGGTISYGDEVDFKSGKVFVNLAEFDSGDADALPVYLFTVIMKSSKEHLAFPITSKLVITFCNDSVIELSSFGGVIKELWSTDGVQRPDIGIDYTGRYYDPNDRPYYNYNNFSMPPIPVYYTGRNYRLDDTHLQKLLMWPIVKMRVEVSDGATKDFKVGKRKGKKVMKQLQNSYFGFLDSSL